MRTALKFGSIAAIVLGFFLFLFTSASIVDPTPSGSHAVDFPRFPRETTKIIEFQPFEEETTGEVEFRPVSYWNGYSQNSTGTRERLDQLRDWLLMTVLSSSNLTQDEINKILFDLPPVRRGALNAVASFEYGLTRSRATAGGHVLGLVPAVSAGERMEHLAHIADEERKNTGEIPAVLDVFEYTIDLDANTAQVRRLDPVQGRELFSESVGYFERDLHGIDDFAKFMALINDVTYARRIAGSLRVGGRRVKEYRGIRLEDVAAIWQSERSIEGSRRGSGFSLDPEIDYIALAADTRAFQNLLTVLGASPEQVSEVLAGFKRKSVGEYLSIGQELCGKTEKASACNKYLRGILLQERFQAARYDGELKGTEVGMVLFYTDLLMKIWSIDYQYATPRPDHVEDFPNELEMRVAKVFKDEVARFPETRLWLGSLEKGYQIGKAREEIFLARNATRVFAVPHDSLENKDVEESAEPHIYDRIFMNWWNQHYEEVAQYEKEYQRLNEIMKWSQIIGWLSPSSASELVFLADVAVAHDNIFYEWVRRHPELTYNDWNAVHFHTAGFHGAATESLPILKSRTFDDFGKDRYWVGGVSLARREAVVARSELSEEVAAMSRRGGLDYTSSVGNKLRTLEKTEFEFASEGGAFNTTARPDSGLRLRSLIGEFRNQSFERVLEHETDGLIFSERSQSGILGELRIAESPEGYRVGWVSREVDAGQSLARRISVAADPEQTLRQDSSLQAIVKLEHAGEYLVKPRASDVWVKLAVSDSEGSELRAGFEARISAPGRQASDVDVAWVRQDVKEQLPEGSYVEIRSDDGADRLIEMRQTARPPPSAKNAEISYMGAKIEAHVDAASGEVYVKWADIPDGLRDSPGRIRNLALGLPPARSDDYAVVLRDLERANYSGAAHSVVRDPAKFRAALDSHLSEELEAYDKLLGSTRPQEADMRLRALISLYGDEPQLTLRSAMAELSRERPDAAAQLMKSVEGRRLANADRFFAEIDQRIKISRTPREAENLREVANYTSISQARLSSNDPLLGEFHLSVDKNRLLVNFQTAHLPSEPATLSEVAAHADAPVYIQDSPGLNSLDFHPGVSQNQLQSLVVSSRISIRKVSLSELSDFRPSSIVETATGTRYRLANQGMSRLNPLSLPRLPSRRPQNCNDAQTNSAAGCGTAYVLVENGHA